jgi:hypothetical protein
MYTNYSNGPAPNRDRRPIKRYGKRKAWYHHNDLCTWDFVTLAAYLTEDIRNGIDPTIRLDRCIGARQTDIQERQPEQGSQNLRTHEIALEKLEALRADLIRMGRENVTAVLFVEDYPGIQGGKFVVGHISSRGGSKRKTRKSSKKSKKSKKQTRRR